MITMIAEKHGFDEADLESDDERLSNPFFEPYIAYGVDTASRSSRLYALQAQIIREEANKGSAIFVGRCADDVLQNYPCLVNIFIYAPRLDRIKRIMVVEGIADNLAADKIVRRIDKTRRAYYQFYTDQKWGAPENKDLMLNSSALGLEESVKFIEDFLERLGYLER
jgi:cytidylate kinase